MRLRSSKRRRVTLYPTGRKEDPSGQSQHTMGVKQTAMIEVNVKHLEQVKFEIEARGHRVISDQPLDSGGQDKGMTPPEFFLGALGSCAAYYAVAYLKKKNLERPGVAVRVKADKAGPPAHMDGFLIEVEVPGPLSEEDRVGVERSVHHCLIHQTMLRSPSIEIAIRTPVTA